LEKNLFSDGKIHNQLNKIFPNIGALGPTLYLWGLLHLGPV